MVPSQPRSFLESERAWVLGCVRVCQRLIHVLQTQVTFPCFLVLNSRTQSLESIFRTEGFRHLSVATQKRSNGFAAASRALCASTIDCAFSLCT